MRVRQLQSEGYSQDSLVAEDHFQDQGLLISGVDSSEALTACGGMCLSATAPSESRYYGSVEFSFWDTTNNTAATVSGISFNTIYAINFTFFDASNQLLGSLSTAAGTSGQDTPWFSANEGIARVLVDFDYAGMYSLNYEGLSAITSSVPEPASLALFGLGFAGVVLRRRKA